MKSDQAVWLPHLSSKVVSEALGHELCAYAVALEGWRRGLTLKWYTKDAVPFQNMMTWHVDAPGKLFSLSSEEKTHYFFRSRGDRVSNEAVMIGADKERTKALLAKAGVPVPEGKHFSADVAIEDISNDVSATISFPVVVKPIDGSFGKGVMTNIQTVKELKKALKHVRNQLHFADVLVERYVPGDEYRFYVAGDNVAGAIKRIPANVVGDGIHSIETLIASKNDERKHNPRLISSPIQIDEEVRRFIQKKGFTLASIPEEGERVFLREKSNVSQGGDPVDVTDDMHPAIKQTAVAAVKAVPALYHGGVDLIIDENKPPQDAAIIIELNPTAQIALHLYPMQGHARDIPAAIVDDYFPGTQRNEAEKQTFYFGFNRVLEPLHNNSAMMTKVSPVHTANGYARKYIVSGDVQGIHYHRRLRDQALADQLHGFINNLDNGDIEVVVAGGNRDQLERFQASLMEDELVHISAEDWLQPVKIGFDIQADPNKITDEMNRMKQEKIHLEKEKKWAEQQYSQYQQSRSWKLTLPLRKVLNYIKRR